MLAETAMSSPNDRRDSSGSALRRTTGRDRPEWFATLDAWGARGRPYREIAEWLKTEHGLSNWWAQKLIVEYEEARGVRDPGVRRDGTFEIGATKTIDAGIEQVLGAFDSPAARKRWLPGVEMGAIDRSAQRVRFVWTDGVSRVTVSATSTSGGKTAVILQHEKIRDADTAAAVKSFWRERLTALRALLES